MKLTFAGTFLIAGLALFAILTAHILAADRNDVPAEIRATRFMLVDSKGQTRGLFGCESDDTPTLRFFDERSRERMTFRLQGSGEPLVVLQDVNGRPTVHILTDKGDPSVMLTAPQGRRSIGLNVTSRLGPSISCYDNSARLRLHVGLLDTGLGEITFLNEQSKVMKMDVQPNQPAVPVPPGNAPDPGNVRKVPSQ